MATHTTPCNLLEFNSISMSFKTRENFNNLDSVVSFEGHMAMSLPCTVRDRQWRDSLLARKSGHNWVLQAVASLTIWQCFTTFYHSFHGKYTSLNVSDILDKVINVCWRNLFPRPHRHIYVLLKSSFISEERCNSWKSSGQLIILLTSYHGVSLPCNNCLL